MTTILIGHVLDRLRELPDNSVQCCVTSPPYWGLRAYGTEPQLWGGNPDCDHQPYCSADTTTWTCARCGAWRGELGAKPTPGLYIEHLVQVFGEVKRVLRPDGTLWLNLGVTYCSSNKGGPWDAGRSDHTPKLSAPEQTYAQQANRQATCGFKPKDLILIPAMTALALQSDGWWLRADIIWHKPNGLPESVTDRPTRAHEQILMLCKQARYCYDGTAIAEPATAGERNPHFDQGKNAETHAQVGRGPRQNAPTRNSRDVWSINTLALDEPHFAAFPPELARRCIAAGTPAGGACHHCGKPYRRTGNGERRAANRERRTESSEQRTGSGNHLQTWQPTCHCPHPQARPCVVLDPFLGSGTTAIVAGWLGRDCTGIELNHQYAAMAQDRINLRGQQRIPTSQTNPDQLTMFAE